MPRKPCVIRARKLTMTPRSADPRYPTRQELRDNSIYAYAIVATQHGFPKACPLPVCRRNRACSGNNRPEQILTERDHRLPFCVSRSEEAYKLCKSILDAVIASVGQG